VAVEVCRWRWDGDAEENLQALAEVLGRPGLLVLHFEGGAANTGEVSLRSVQRWTVSRAVTVAVLHGRGLKDPALGAALSADFVFVSEGSSVDLPPGTMLPSPALMLAARRAGSEAMRRVLLGEGSLEAAEVVRLGLAHALVKGENDLPIPVDGALSALTAVRDILRAGASGANALALEAAAFQLLFAAGHPQEGASAFFARHRPRFPDGGSTK